MTDGPPASTVADHDGSVGRIMAKSETAMTSRLRGSLTPLVILAVAAVGWVECSSIPPGPAMLPRILLIIMAIIAVLMLGRALLGKTSGESERIFTDAPAFFITAAMGLALIWAMSWLGFFTSAFLFFVGFVLINKHRNHLQSAAAIVIFLGLIYVVFVWALQRPLPPELILNAWG